MALTIFRQAILSGLSRLWSQSSTTPTDLVGMTTLVDPNGAVAAIDGNGCVRSVACDASGAPIDAGLPTRTAPYATGTMTVAGTAVGTAAPAAPAAAAVVGGPKRRKIYNTGTTTIWYGPLATLTADVGAATSGIPLLAGASDDLEGYTGEIYVRGAAAGSVGIRMIG